ncbi:MULTISPECIES: lipopolysaccharide biosynthesis protein [Loigolactobacillus]|uniref:Lipopolysaccharide biosynthesis protein n=1 Tax=Loigolactobacillus backii TaxID=375175 RepID=A0A192GZG3_9LACO|nr:MULTISPECIES: lipopolysaccharide biosynthesis protein [Loigolactobacillus]ANK60498.1 hypothetical protein AYR52_09670 [Loigolactobacillus backii]ANK61924.1 hypothetical protein AYR53_03560 [Loigolactobacillus backii]ANK65459.1 hypothetical protein AYR54_09555 [Loigolactobacillus backii]ANK68882.1 hypothetical protein AYR56_01165 [Loigolactobacillus backii]MDA5386882.1 lipopolysaccharide biosynthesis protein [Loigolactobacillus backii]
MAQPTSLRLKAINGFLWTGVELLGNQGLKLVIQIFLARLLIPADFGVIGMINIFIALSQSLIDSGFQNALIREKKITMRACTTVFVFNILCAALLYGLLFASAPLIADFYKTGILVPVIRVVSSILLINSLSLISRTILARELNFKVQMKITLTGSVVSGGLAIGLALAGFGVWSIVWQMVVTQIWQTIGFMIAAKWWPKWEFDFKALKKMYSFGWKLTAAGLINTTYNNLLYVVIGRFFSVTTLGYFTNAEKISQMTTDSTTVAIQKVSYPALSKIQSDKVALHNGYRRVILHTIYFIFPLMIGIGALSKPILVLVFGQQWAPAAPFLLPLCLAGIFFPLQAINLNILQIFGRSDLFLRLEVIKKGVGLGLFGLVYLLQLNIMVLIWLLVVHALFSFVLDSFYSGRFVSYTTFQQIKDSLVILGLSGFMGVSVAGLHYFLGQITWINLMIEVTFGVGIYLVGSHLLRINEFKSYLAIFGRLFQTGFKDRFMKKGAISDDEDS